MNQITMMKYKQISILILITILLLSACKGSNKQSTLSEHYDVIDSGLISGGDSINWMDNERIILRAVDPEKPLKGKIYIWEISSNKIIEYSEGGMPCYYDGYIFYGYKTDLKLTKEKPYGASWKEGFFEKEKLFTRTHRKGEGRKWHKENVRNPFSCRLNKRPKGMENHIWIPLLEKHGYLEFGMKGTGMNSDDNVFLYKNNGENHKLNFLKKDVSTQKSQYVEFRKQYFFWDLITSNKQREIWKKNKCTNGWWINPETGDSYSECIPYAPWKSSRHVVPTIKGLFMVNYNYMGENPKDSGGYLYGNKIFKPVIKGLIHRAKVSPDGCKVAMTHKLGNYTNLKVKMTLKVINICNEKE